MKANEDESKMMILSWINLRDINGRFTKKAIKMKVNESSIKKA